VGKFLNFLLVPIYAKTFPPELYGVIDLFDALVFFLLIVASLEIPTAMGRYFYAEDTIDHRRRIINTSLFLTLIFTVATILLVWIFKIPLLERYLAGTEHENMLTVSLIWLFTLTVNTFLSFIPRYDNRPKVYVLVGIISISIKLVSSILFVVVLKTGLMGVLYGYICGNLASIVMYVWVSRRYFRFQFSTKYAGKMLIYAFPLLLGSVLVELWKPWLRHMITLYFPIAVVGLYAFAIRLTSVNMIVHGAFKTAWKPLLFEKKDDFIKGTSMKRISGLVAMASILMGCMIACFAKEATLIVGSEDYLPSVQLTGLLAMAGFLQMMSELRGFGPYIADKTYIVTIANVVAVAAASGFLLTVKDSAGVYGIGYACIIYELICYVILVAYTSWKYHIVQHNLWEIPLVLLFCLCIYLSATSSQLRYRTAAAILSSMVAVYLFFTKYYRVNINLRGSD
jgi:O-antigen/teichoic acid export membrane protein